MPNSYNPLPLSRHDIFAAVPGLAVMEALFERLSDQTFCIKNSRRCYVSANTAFVIRTGLPGKSTVLGRKASEVFPPLLAAGYEHQDDAVFATGKAFRDKLEMATNQDGTTGWYLTQKQPILDPRGRVIALAAVSTDLELPASADPRLQALALAVDRIRTDFSSPLRISELAQAAWMSVSQFERKMYSVFRMSPRRLLTRTRVEAAAKALRETQLPLSQIACDCGFYDQAQFCRQFRMISGMPPGRYRSAAMGRTQAAPDELPCPDD